MSIKSFKHNLLENIILTQNPKAIVALKGELSIEEINKLNSFDCIDARSKYLYDVFDYISKKMNVLDEFKEYPLIASTHNTQIFPDLIKPIPMLLQDRTTDISRSSFNKCDTIAWIDSRMYSEVENHKSVMKMNYAINNSDVEPIFYKLLNRYFQHFGKQNFRKID